MQGIKRNLWCVKVVLRIFEMVSGLKVNFHKSCIMGLNIEEEEVELAKKFLYFKRGETPFKFLGIPIGANPRISVTCKPVVKKLRDKLSMWRTRQLSMGGQITLINSVLASLPLYYFSFFKVPKKVLKEMIQHNFLWGGKGDVRKMAWIRWSKLCVPEENGGLGIRNVEVLNMSLLGKWRWRILVEKNGEWSVLLDRLYVAGGILSLGQYSVWWKDINGLDKSLSFALGRFREALRVKLGNGSIVRFWHDRWCGPRKLLEIYPNLFAVAEDQNCTVAASEGGLIIGGSGR